MQNLISKTFLRKKSFAKILPTICFSFQMLANWIKFSSLHIEEQERKSSYTKQPSLQREKFSVKYHY